MPIRQVVLRSNVLINILTDFLEMGRFTFVDIKNMLWRMKMSLMGRFFPKKLIGYRFHDVYGRFINWNSPQTLDEKINWLKLYSDTSLWPNLADKYEVRKYVSERGFSDSLVKLYGKWEKVEDIDWNSLPNKFIVKTNNGSGDVIKCSDKSSFDYSKNIKLLKNLLQLKFGYDMGEQQYAKIRPCIIVEELLDSESQAFQSDSLIDYKILSFDGRPAYVWVCFNRTSHSTDVAVYDLDWIFHPEFSISTSHYKLCTKTLPRPKALDEMVQMASVLSKGFPFVRVDLYEVGGKPYFGEMTFAPAAGFNTFFSYEFQMVLGNKIILPQKL